MEKPATIIKSLRTICLIGVITLGLMTIVGTGGGGGDSATSTTATTPDTTTETTTETTTDTTTDTTTGGGDVTVGDAIDTDWIAFNVDTARSLIATENRATSSARRSVSNVYCSIKG